MNDTIEKFCFPIKETMIIRPKNDAPENEWLRMGHCINEPSYKAIVRQDTDKLISIVKDTYQPMPNRKAIQATFKTLEHMGIQFEYEPDHSYCLDNKMRLNLTLPGYQIDDGKEGIKMALSIFNSYDMSKSFGIRIGALVMVCTNGMMIMKNIGAFWHKHTKGLNIEGISEYLEWLPAARESIGSFMTTGRTMKPTEFLWNKMDVSFSKKMVEYVRGEEPQSVWEMYDASTYFISHDVRVDLRDDYQGRLGRVFSL